MQIVNYPFWTSLFPSLNTHMPCLLHFPFYTITKEAENNIQKPGQYGPLSSMAKSCVAENPAFLDVNNCQSGIKSENQLTANTRHSHVLYCLLVIVCLCLRWC